jgi:DNA replication and repair protein RecF
MTLKNVKISNCRNLESASLAFSSVGLNVITGKNGSGKTSLLEAIHILSCGRSFRTNDVSQAIRNKESEFALFGEIDTGIAGSGSLGFSRNLSGKTVAKLSGKAAKASDLARALPVRSINPIESTELINGGPKKRREFIDWGVFHVKHSYGDILKRFNRVIKQRNMALKQRCSVSELKEWNLQFVTASGEVDSARKEYLNEWIDHFSALTSHIGLFEELRFQYKQGWGDEDCLLEVLERQEGKERAMGYGLYGAQRADLQITLSGESAVERLSRGQQKLCAVAMYLAQGAMLKELSGRHPLYLIDDFSSELDSESQDLLLNVLTGQKTQIILTCLSLEASLLAIRKKKGIALSLYEIQDGCIRGVGGDTVALREDEAVAEMLGLL